jgi:hypothetical protein
MQRHEWIAALHDSAWKGNQMPKPTPPIVPDGLTAQEQQAFLIKHGQAFHLTNTAAALYLAGSVAPALSRAIVP